MKTFLSVSCIPQHMMGFPIPFKKGYLRQRHPSISTWGGSVTRVLLLGSGAMGSVAASHMVGCKEIDSIVVADVVLERARRLASKLKSNKVEARGIDAGDQKDLRTNLKGMDLAINAAHADFDLSLMEVCLKVGVNYMDLSSIPDRQLPQDWKWRNAGLVAFLGAGEDPGISNTLARYAADHMDSVDAIRIRDGDTVRAKDYALAPVWSAETFFSEALSPSIYWDGGLRTAPPLSGREIYNFPDPVGPQPVYLMEHEEPITLPHFIKGLKYCDLKLAIDDQTVRNLLFLQSLGMLKTEKMKVRGVEVSPRDVLLSLLPQPVDMAGRVEGHAMIVVEVEGMKKGERVVHKLWSGLSHEEAFKRYGATATAYMTGTGTGICAIMFARGHVNKRGVISAECLDPQVFIGLMKEKDIPANEEISITREPLKR